MTYRKSEQINELVTALAQAQGEIGGATKDRTNPAFRSTYATLASVRDAIRAPLSTHGLAILQLPTVLEEGVLVTTILSHTSGQFIENDLVVPIGKRDAQGIGSAITYASRYSLMAMLGVAPEDDDGEAAVGRPADAGESSPAQLRPAATPKGAQPLNQLGASNLHKRLGAMGVPHDEHYALAGRAVGREVTSFSQLTTDDVGRVVDLAKTEQTQAS